VSLLHTIKTCYIIYIPRMSCSFLYPYSMGSFILYPVSLLILWKTFLLYIGFSKLLLFVASSSCFSRILISNIELLQEAHSTFSVSLFSKIEILFFKISSSSIDFSNLLCKYLKSDFNFLWVASNLLDLWSSYWNASHKES